MDASDFLYVRQRASDALRACARRGAPRLSFNEFSMLCLIADAAGPLRASDIARGQGVSRPTTSHRLRKLESMGLIERSAADADGRGVLCSLSPAGAELVGGVSSAIAGSIGPQERLYRSPDWRIQRYVEAAGSLPLSAGDALLLALYAASGPLGVMDLQRATGLLQPTCSIALSRLVDEGLVARSGKARLTGEGAERARAIAASVEKVATHHRLAT